ncbi:hypothetical protein, partial [Providencia sp. MGF014]|uniref:hypothetical protein n=1 Tax=Providencia sp. MGF014 TaxID=2565573 RepID=UPI001982617B
TLLAQSLFFIETLADGWIRETAKNQKRLDSGNGQKSEKVRFGKKIIPDMIYFERNHFYNER